MLIETLLYTAIVYFTTDIGRSFETFLSISLSITMSGICAIAYGFFLSGLFESFFIGAELSSIVDLVLLLVSGVYINVKTVPLLKYISFFFYANENVSISFWLSIDESMLRCDTERGYACFLNGTEVLESLGYGTSKFDIYQNYLYQLVLTLVVHVFAFIGIRRNVRKVGFY